MLKKTAESLGLTPYINEDSYGPPKQYINPAFYKELEHDDDPPLYIAVLEEFMASNQINANDESNEN